MKNDVGSAIPGKRKRVNVTWTRITSARIVHRFLCGKGSDRKMEVIYTTTEAARDTLALISDKTE